MGQPHASKHRFPHLNLTHQHLDQLFSKHQEALKAKRLEEALVYFEDYSSAVTEHLENEENSLLPFYKEDMDRFRFGGFEEILSEHRKISEGLVLIRVLLQKRIGGTDSPMTYQLVLKEEFYFLKLLHVHEQKEERSFFPKLDKILGRYN